MNVRAVRGEELLARLGRDACVQGGQHRVAKRHRDLARDFADFARHVVVLDLLELGPGREPAALAVVAVHGQKQLGADQQDFATGQ